MEPWLDEAESVCEQLGIDPLRGLSPEAVERRLQEVGPNELRAAATVPLWRAFLSQFRDPLVVLLLVAVAVSLVAWAAEGRDGWPWDALVIAVIVVANAALGLGQERKAENAVAALQQMSAPMATVLRGGDQVRVPTREVVPGDVLLLAEGDTVAADGRLLQAANLMVAEAQLTGESEPVAKTTAALAGEVALGDRSNMVFAGTAVTRGTGRAVVTTTGMDTEAGRIAELLEETSADPTPLQREIRNVGRTLGIAVVAIAVVVVGTVLLVARVDALSDLVTVLLLGVSLAVAAVPEGLPAVLSVVLAIGVQRMAARNAIVRHLAAVEALGSASVVCSDKTGTLTENRMTLVRIVTRSGEVTVTGGHEPGHVQTLDGRDPEGALRREVAAVLTGGSLANDALLTEDWQSRGDPTEVAFLVAAAKFGDADRDRFRRLAEVPFTSERKLMSTVDQEDTGSTWLFVKGAPDVLLDRCRGELAGTEVAPLDRDRITAAVAEMSDDALRTLAVARRELRDWSGAADEDLEHELVWCGVVGIIDPPRQEASAAVAAAQRAGVRVMMITGDHPRTARRIATDLGIVPSDAPVATGPELEHVVAWEELVRGVSVFARVAPEHKLHIVDALQAAGNVVAMTGDGVNDAPALKSADIGVAMGRTGTDVTRAAADMILADDNFATIVAAIREGRGIFANIKKFLRYLLSSNMGEVLTVFLGVVGAGVLGLTAGEEAVVLPLLAVQILWINLLTDTGPALAMGIDPQVEDVMGRPPRRLTDRVIDARMWWGVAVVGVVMALATLFTIDLYLPGGVLPGDRDLTNARTAGFTVLVLAQLFNALNARSETVSAFRRLLVNGWLWAALLLSLLLQVAVVHLAPLNVAFGTAPLSIDQWLVCLGMASAVLWAGELRKALLRMRS